MAHRRRRSGHALMNRCFSRSTVQTDVGDFCVSQRIPDGVMKAAQNQQNHAAHTFCRRALRMPSAREAGRQAISVAGIALDHHGKRLEDGHLRRDDRRTAGEQEVSAPVAHRVQEQGNVRTRLCCMAQRWPWRLAATPRSSR